MNKKIFIIVFVAIVIIAVAGLIFWKNNAPKSEIVYFWGEGCPHCINVEQFVKDNNIQEKVSYTRKEVFNNKDNAKELITAAQKCGLASGQVGVPLLYDKANSKCYEGDADVINFLKQKAGIQ
jgi:hypothetical protein